MGQQGKTSAARPATSGGLDRLDVELLALAALALTGLTAAGTLLFRVTPRFDWVGVHGAIAVSLAIAALSAVATYARVARARRAQRRRVIEMRDAARELGGGDLSVSVPEASDDLGALAASLNAMASRVSRLVTAQRDLLSGVSHELRSPLARISVALELIEMGRGEHDPDLVELLAGLREEVALLERHISRLLEAQRVSSKRVLLKRRPLQIDALVQQVVARERQRLERLGWRHTLALGAGASEVLADENALDRVLSTLIENAIQHAGADPAGVDGRSSHETARFAAGAAAARDGAGGGDDGGPSGGGGGIVPALHIETGVDDGGIFVRVGDRGPGLTDAQCAVAFEPFARIDSSRSTRTGGTGLGLYLARTILEAHGGSASARPRPGGGLLVELRLRPRGQHEQKATMRVALDTRALANLGDRLALAQLSADDGDDEGRDGETARHPAAAAAREVRR